MIEVKANLGKYNGWRWRVYTNIARMRDEKGRPTSWKELTLAEGGAASKWGAERAARRAQGALG